MSTPPDGAFENGSAPAKPELDVLRCVRCGAPLRVKDAPRVRCAACGEERDVPAPHRHAVRLTKRADAELYRAGQIWLELQRSTLSRAKTLAMTHAPTAALGLGLVWLGCFRLESPSLSSFAVCGLAVIFIALPIGVRAAVHAAYHGVPIEEVWSLAAGLASRGENECRACGAPLDVAPRAIFVRCFYCGTDSLVLLDAKRRAMRYEEIDKARKLSRDALSIVKTRLELSTETSILGIVVAGVTSVIGFIGAAVPLGTLGGLRNVLVLAFAAACLSTSIYVWFIASTPHIRGNRWSGARSRRVESLVWGLGVALLQAPAWTLLLFSPWPRVGIGFALASLVPILGWIWAHVRTVRPEPRIPDYEERPYG